MTMAMDTDLAEQRRLVTAERRQLLAQRPALALGATRGDLHYTVKGQAPAQDLLLGVQMQTTLDDPKRMRMQPEVFYVKTAEEMAELLCEQPEPELSYV